MVFIIIIITITIIIVVCITIGIIVSSSFFMLHSLQSSASIEPKQGRMFALTTEDKHHLDKVNKGHSYALIIWFTLSPADQELDHAEARTILRIVEEGASRYNEFWWL